MLHRSELSLARRSRGGPCAIIIPGAGPSRDFSTACGVEEGHLPGVPPNTQVHNESPIIITSTGQEGASPVRSRIASGSLSLGYARSSAENGADPINFFREGGWPESAAARTDTPPGTGPGRGRALRARV